MPRSEWEGDPLRQLLSALPRNLRDSLGDYLERVEEHTPTIFEGVGVPLTPASRRAFMFGVAVRKLWSKVNSQYWTMASAVNLLRGFGVDEAAVGGARYSPRSQDYVQVRNLHSGLGAEIRLLGLEEVANALSLGDVALATYEQE